MPRLRVVPLKSDAAQLAIEKGKLFEKLVAEVLRREGYEIVAGSPRVNYAGMEIDIEGTQRISRLPFIAECKAHETPLDAPSVHAFIGKYFSHWKRDNRLTGLFIALPGINSTARGFWNVTVAEPSIATLILLEEGDVIKQLVQGGLVPSLPTAGSLGPICEGLVLGDALLAVTDVGYYWVQLLIQQGQTTPSYAIITDQDGQCLPDGEIQRLLLDRIPELEGMLVLRAPATRGPATAIPDAQFVAEVVSVKPSSSWFEYQFPAAPEYFVGREHAVEAIQQFATEVRTGRTSARGLLVQANSGWGKSSLILKARHALADSDCLVVAIDSRAASTPHFTIRAVDYALREAVDAAYLDLDRDSLRIGGMSSLSDVLERVGANLQKRGKLLCVAFDQFEGVLATPSILENVASLVSVVTDLGGPILLCFAWKTDLVGPTQDFPYRIRDEISNRCRALTLERFSESETAALLKALERELRRELTKHLKFLLRESSQGYPWLLKKLCAHVFAQIERGAKQIDLATQMLRVKELFEADLAGLPLPQHEALRSIARVAPVAYTDVAEIASVDVLDSLIHKRLIVLVGNKYHIYWDIFRDYLNTGALPAEESFILRSSFGSALAALQRVRAAGPEGLQLAPASLGTGSKGVVYNLVRDLQLLGLVTLQDGRIIVSFDAPGGEALHLSLQKPVQDKMRRHLIAKSLLDRLDDSEPLSLDEVAKIMRQMCPYITADERTWSGYARILVKWLELAQLVTFERHQQVIRRFDLLTDLTITPWAFAGLARRKRPFIPEVQYQRLEAAMLDIGDAIAEKQSRVTLTRLTTMSAWRKAVHTAREVQLLDLVDNAIRVTESGLAFIGQPDQRRIIFHQQAVSCIPAYAKFLDIVADPSAGRWSLCQLGQELSKRLGTHWKESTATWVAKILNNWAKAAGEVPDARRGDRRRSCDQLPLHDAQPDSAPKP